MPSILLTLYDIFLKMSMWFQKKEQNVPQTYFILANSRLFEYIMLVFGVYIHIIALSTFSRYKTSEKSIDAFGIQPIVDSLVFYDIDPLQKPGIFQAIIATSH